MLRPYSFVFIPFKLPIKTTKQKELRTKNYTTFANKLYYTVDDVVIKVQYTDVVQVQYIST